MTNMSRYSRFLLYLIRVGTVLFITGMLALLVLRGETALGYDGYYYALQIRAMERGSELLYRNDSWVFSFLSALNRIINNPSLTPRIAAVFAALVSVLTLSAASRPGRPRLQAIVLLLLGLSPTWLYLHLEFIKNAVGLSCLLALIAVVRRWFPEGRSLTDLWVTSWRRTLSGLCLVATLFMLSTGAHRLTAILAGSFIMLRMLVRLLPLEGRIRSNRLLLIAMLLSTMVALALLVGIQRYLPELSLVSPLSRLSFFFTASFGIHEALWFCAYQIGLFVYAFYVVLSAGYRWWRQRQHLEQNTQSGRETDAAIFLTIAVALALPFFPLQTDALMFRVLLVSPIFLALHILDLPRREYSLLYKRVRSAFLGASFIVALGFSVMVYTEALSGWEGRKYPPYTKLLSELHGLEDYVRGRSLIAHRGLSCALWYELGVHCESYTMPETMPLRLVYGFQPEAFTSVLNSGEKLSESVLFSSEHYTLVEDELWLRFATMHERAAQTFSLFNPQKPRPESDQSLNETAVHSLSPLTYIKD